MKDLLGTERPREGSRVAAIGSVGIVNGWEDEWTYFKLGASNRFARAKDLQVQGTVIAIAFSRQNAFNNNISRVLSRINRSTLV